MAKQKETPTAVDLEETAELPIIPAGAAVAVTDDALSSTDAYNAPTVMRALPAAGEETREAKIAQREAEIGALRSDLASVTEHRGQLVQNLGNLTSNLRELEALLNAKSEQLSMFEREVGQRDRRIAELTARATELDTGLRATTTERDALRGDLKTAREDAESSHHRVGELEARTATLDGELAATTSERDSLRTDLKAAREDAESSRKLIQARDASEGALLKERDQQNRRVRQLEADLTQLRASAERYRESLQSLEGRRQIFVSMLDERETEVLEHGNTLVRLQAEMSERTKVNVTRETDLKSSLVAEQERVRQLEQAAIIARSEHESLRQAANDAARAADQQIVSLRSELELQRTSMHAELESQRKMLQAEIETQRAAMQAELDSRQAALDALQVQADKVNSSLNERNKLIARFEAEMQSSSQVLGTIQHNLQHLGDAESTRMLVRTQGDTGIVHMLGRRTTVGRTPDNDIRIDEDFISRHHAVLLLSGVTTVAEDLNSTNGTYVNGERINRRTLKEGDLVTLGKTEFRFVVKKPSDKPA